MTPECVSLTHRTVSMNDRNYCGRLKGLNVVPRVRFGYEWTFFVPTTSYWSLLVGHFRVLRDAWVSPGSSWAWSLLVSSRGGCRTLQGCDVGWQERLSAALPKIQEIHIHITRYFRGNTQELCIHSSYNPTPKWEASCRDNVGSKKEIFMICIQTNIPLSGPFPFVLVKK